MGLRTCSATVGATVPPDVSTANTGIFLLTEKILNLLETGNLTSLLRSRPGGTRQRKTESYIIRVGNLYDSYMCIEKNGEITDKIISTNTPPLSLPHPAGIL